MIEDKRKSERQRVFLRGFIRTAQDDSGIDCIVRDISETGAKLRFKSKPSIGGSFELHMPTKGQVLPSKLVWHDNCEVGVSFDSVAALGTPPSSEKELQLRMSLLENEITALKQMLKHLQKRIEKADVA